MKMTSSEAKLNRIEQFLSRNYQYETFSEELERVVKDRKAQEAFDAKLTWAKTLCNVLDLVFINPLYMPYNFLPVFTFLFALACAAGLSEKTGNISWLMLVLFYVVLIIIRKSL
jgi:hypothetical protein